MRLSDLVHHRQGVAHLWSFDGWFSLAREHPESQLHLRLHFEVCENNDLCVLNVLMLLQGTSSRPAKKTTTVQPKQAVAPRSRAAEPDRAIHPKASTTYEADAEDHAEQDDFAVHEDDAHMSSQMRPSSRIAKKLPSLKIAPSTTQAHIRNSVSPSKHATPLSRSDDHFGSLRSHSSSPVPGKISQSPVSKKKPVVSATNKKQSLPELPSLPAKLAPSSPIAMRAPESPHAELPKLKPNTRYLKMFVSVGEHIPDPRANGTRMVQLCALFSGQRHCSPVVSVDANSAAFNCQFLFELHSNVFKQQVLPYYESYFVFPLVHWCPL